MPSGKAPVTRSEKRRSKKLEVIVRFMEVDIPTPQHQAAWDDYWRTKYLEARKELRNATEESPSRTKAKQTP
jgi:hypothetical protein